MSQWQQTCRGWPDIGTFIPTGKPTKKDKKPKPPKGGGGLPKKDLVLWLDGSDYTTMYNTAGSQPFGLGTSPIPDLTGQQVGCWADKSGNDNHLNNADNGRRPDYRVSVQNGLSAIKGTVSTPAYKLFATSSVLSQDKEVTIFFVGNGIVDEGFSCVYSNTNLFGTGIRMDAWIDTRTASRTTPLLVDSSGANVAANPADIGTEFNQHSMIVSGGDILARLNGVAGTPVTLAGDGNTPNDYTRILCSAEDFYQHGGYLCEILVYDAALSTANIKKAEKYLKNKWATP